MTGDLFRQGETAVPAQQVLGSADLQNLRGLVLDDPVRAMHILPGVAATDDLYSEFSVRGSDFGRIGLAVDGVPSRFLSHSVQGVEDGGSIGMINSDVLESVSLQNGSYPQRFGNRTGAQIEMTLREGSRDRTQARVALSGSSASVVGEGPIGRGRKASWLLSARKSYLDLLIKQIADNETFAFGFTDVAAKLVVDVTARHQLQVSALAGRAALDADQRDIGLERPAGRDQSRLAGRARLAVHAGAAGHLDAARRRHRRRVLQSQPRARGARRRTVDRRLGALGCGDRRAPVARPSRPAPRRTGRTNASPSAASSIRRARPTSARTPRSSRGGSAATRWRDGRCRAGRILGAGARVDHWDGTGETTASPWLNAQVRVGPFDVVGGTGLFRQFPGFNAIVGLRGTPGLPAERAWHADIGVGRRFGAHLRAQAVWFHRDERDGLRLPGDEWQLVDGRPRPPLDRHRLRRAARRHVAGRRAAACSGAARTGSRAGPATRWAATGSTTS